MAAQETSTFMTPSPPSYSSGNASKPTLLAFHGSGSNATVHMVQLARLARLLKPYFEIECLQAPFPSPAGPGVLPFFDGCGPFVRWLPINEKITVDNMKRGNSTPILANEIESLVRDKVREVNARGSKAVGLIGFSQGTKVVAGLLRGTEIRRAVAPNDEETAWLDFSFALSVCGSYPPPLVPQSATALLASAEALSDEEKKEIAERRIRIPVFHVQGEKDEWHWAGKGLIEGNYEVGEGKSEVVEWDMGHHYPVQAENSEAIKEWLAGNLGGIQEGRSRV